MYIYVFRIIVEKYAFQSVALVKRSHEGGFAGLKGGRLCHPGYGKAKEQLWSDRVLKYFEKKVYIYFNIILYNIQYIKQNVCLYLVMRINQPKKK